MKISIIVAVDKNNLIGKKNSLPWHLPADLKHFKNITMGHHVVFGQTTYKSLGRPLPGRINIILSSDHNYRSQDAIVVRSPREAIEFAKKAGEKELLICGGAQVYKSFLPLTNRIYLTKIYHEFEGDIYFPEINMKKWKTVSKEFHKPDKQNLYPYEFLILDKKASQ